MSSIDGFIEFTVVDASNPVRKDAAILFGSNFSSNRVFYRDSTIDAAGAEIAFNYQSNSWYRLVIEGSATQNIRAFVFQ
jgi:hypothetical protein